MSNSLSHIRPWQAPDYNPKKEKPRFQCRCTGDKAVVFLRRVILAGGWHLPEARGPQDLAICVHGTTKVTPEQYLNTIPFMDAIREDFERSFSTSRL